MKTDSTGFTPTPQDVIDAANHATDALLQNAPSHSNGYSELEQLYFKTITSVRELNKAAARAKRAAKAEGSK